MKGEHLLVTGGAGSFGRAFVEHVLEAPDGPGLVTVFSRDERKHHEMANELTRHANRLRFVIGDVRDIVRLDEALSGVNVVIHAAAMKHVPATEANPYECVRTNVEGSRNLAVAANRNGVKRVVAVSSDKAVSPSTVYGATKMQMERVLVQAGLASSTLFTVVRYANVFASSGSVVPLFLGQREGGVLTITDPGMTRFSITMREGIDLVLFALTEGLGGEIFIPIAPSYRVGDVAMAIAPDMEHRIIGPRPGEKMHEALFSLTEAPFVLRRSSRYVLLPQSGQWTLAGYAAECGAESLGHVFEYDSESNSDWLAVEGIRSLVGEEAAVEC